MEEKIDITPIKTNVNAAKSVIVILPPNPEKDLVDAGVALHLAFKDSGKNSQIGCGTEIKLDPDTVGVSEITDSIGSRNLVISFDYKEEDLDKVDYDVRDDGKFYLLIKPKPNSPVPDTSNVKFSYKGASADLVITLGINSLEELGKIYADEKHFLDNADILSLNTNLSPSSFTGNHFHSDVSSFSELVSSFVESIGLKISTSVAESLLANIYSATNNLSSPRLTADTFAQVAFLMRAGAKTPTQRPTFPKFSQPPFFEVTDSPIPEEENIPLPEEEEIPVPSDWNKPKIFRVKQ